jgi:cytochrome c-type biogenesis protein CcmE
MYGNKVKLRIFFLLLVITLLVLITSLVLKSLKQNVVYFISPTEIKNLPELNKNKIRVGGMVKKNSLIINSKKINFIITDFKNEIQVTFTGTVPNLFSEGKGVVAEGYLKDRNFLVAKKILAKHDENYMPPEVKKALEENK